MSSVYKTSLIINFYCTLPPSLLSRKAILTSWCVLPSLTVVHSIKEHLQNESCDTSGRGFFLTSNGQNQASAKGASCHWQSTPKNGEYIKFHKLLAPPSYHCIPFCRHVFGVMLCPSEYVTLNWSDTR